MAHETSNKTFYLISSSVADGHKTRFNLHRSEDGLLLPHDTLLLVIQCGTELDLYAPMNLTLRKFPKEAEYFLAYLLGSW